MQLGIVCIKYQSNHPNRASPIGTNQMWNTGNSRPTLIRQKFCYSLVVIVEQALQWPLVSCARMCVRASVHVQWAPDQSWHCVHPASLVLRSSAKPYPPSHRHQVFSLSLFVNDSNLLWGPSLRDPSRRATLRAGAGGLRKRPRVFFERDLQRIWVWMERWIQRWATKGFPQRQTFPTKIFRLPSCLDSITVWRYQTGHLIMCRGVPH